MKQEKRGKTRTNALKLQNDFILLRKVELSKEQEEKKRAKENQREKEVTEKKEEETPRKKKRNE